MKSQIIFPPNERPLLEDLEQDPYREEGLVKAITALEAIEKEYEELRQQIYVVRTFQKDYFKQPRKPALIRAKEQELILDKMINHK